MRANLTVSRCRDATRVTETQSYSNAPIPFRLGNISVGTSALEPPQDTGHVSTHPGTGAATLVQPAPVGEQALESTGSPHAQWGEGMPTGRENARSEEESGSASLLVTEISVGKFGAQSPTHTTHQSATRAQDRHRHPTTSQRKPIGMDWAPEMGYFQGKQSPQYEAQREGRFPEGNINPRLSRGQLAEPEYAILYPRPPSPTQRSTHLSAQVPSHYYRQEEPQSAPQPTIGRSHRDYPNTGWFEGSNPPLPHRNQPP